MFEANMENFYVEYKIHFGRIRVVRRGTFLCTSNIITAAPQLNMGTNCRRPFSMVQEQKKGAHRTSCFQQRDTRRL